MSKVNLNTIDPSTGTDITLGASGDTITVPSGATFTQSGTMNASAITAGTMATARLGSGTASSSTVLYGDQTYKAEPGGANTPMFSAECTSNTVIANSTWVRVPFNVETIDTGSTFNTTTGTFTPGDTSVYLLGAAVTIKDVGDGKKFQMSLYEDGASKYSVGQADFMNTSGVDENLTVWGTWMLTSASDSAYYEIYVFQNKGSGQEIRGDFLNNFWGIKIIP